jgi:hypothetical protein
MLERRDPKPWLARNNTQRDPDRREARTMIARA